VTKSAAANSAKKCEKLSICYSESQVLWFA